MVPLHQRKPNITITKVNEGKPKLDIKISGGVLFKPNSRLISNIKSHVICVFWFFLSILVVVLYIKCEYELKPSIMLYKRMFLENTKVLDELLVLEKANRDYLSYLTRKMESYWKFEEHIRKKRSVNHNNREGSKSRKRSRCNRTKTIETVAIQFRGSNPDGYENRPMEGTLGPWFEGPEFGRNMESFGVMWAENDRRLEISKKGLYYIYSQVTYLSKGTLNSYSINIITTSSTNGKTNTPAALCSVVGTDDNEAEISCFTSTIRILNPTDIVYLQQNQRNRTILFENNTTFFGLILLREL